jgi:4-diphosphocytidyl-2-C-methyl-D-erythritol kinase
MFNLEYLKRMSNSLEPIALRKYSKLTTIKLFLENSFKPVFVRMTGSGSALVAYFESKQRCVKAKKQFNKKYKNYWCISSKTM